MKFWISLLLFIVVGLVLAATAGPAAVLVWGVIYVVIRFVASEVAAAKTKEGRKRLQKEKKDEEEYVEYWGTTKYWDDQKKDR